MAIEKVRFGERLKMQQTIQEECKPLPASAPVAAAARRERRETRHRRASGRGEIRLSAERQNGRLAILVENSWTRKLRPEGRGHGLKNVERRLEARYGKDASMLVNAEGELFQVRLSLPAESEEKREPVAREKMEGAHRRRRRARAARNSRVSAIARGNRGRRGVRERHGSGKAVAEHKPNLIFLDVQMPKLTGFDVLELIGTEMPVIFVTAYDEYAMRAFDVHAVDYLLKPIGRERFDAAVDRAKGRLGEKMPLAHELATAARPPQQFSSAWW